MPSRVIKIRSSLSGTDWFSLSEKPGSKQGLRLWFFCTLVGQVEKDRFCFHLSLHVIIEHISAILFSQIMTCFWFHLLISNALHLLETIHTTYCHIFGATWPIRGQCHRPILDLMYLSTFNIVRVSRKNKMTSQ